MKIFILCYNHTLKYFIEYINSIKQIYNNIEIYQMIRNDKYYDHLTFDYVKNNFNNKNLFIFVQGLPNIFLNQIQWHPFFYVLNTEQNTRNNLFLHAILKLPNSIRIIDYSRENIRYLMNHNIFKNIIYIPYQVNSSEIYNYDKKYEIGMMTHLSERRQTIFDNLKLRMPIDEISGFDLERDNYLFKHKILVNIHYNNGYSIFEQFRCNRCILNKMIVITETSDLSEYELKDYVIMCDYNEIVDKCIEVLNNYDDYYDKLFGNFDLEQIKEKYRLTTQQILYTLEDLKWHA